MIYSIRRFLLINLLIIITVIASLNSAGTYFLDKIAIQNHLDIQLQQITSFLRLLLIQNPSKEELKTIQQLISHKNLSVHLDLPIKPSLALPLKNESYFQIADQQGNIVLSYPNATNTKLFQKKPGFHDLLIKQRVWRVFNYYDPKLKLTFSVSEPYHFRNQLEQVISWDNLIILLWTYPILGLLIWLTVGQGFRPIKKLEDEIASRPATNFNPIDLKNIPIEIKPLIEELNMLFHRLEEEFERNQHFASDAAHELRTPLAALKTQSQLILLANSEEEKQATAKNILKGVDRCTHLVQQLLTLSRVSQSEILKDLQSIDLSKIAAETLAQLAPAALEKNIDIELKKPYYAPVKIYGNETMIHILIRNLVDNAIRYTPENGRVHVEVVNHVDQIIVRITDSGPGIPPDLHARVFERFYRVLGTQASGSGLGLAIAKQIAVLHHGEIKLNTPVSGSGLEVEITLPSAESFEKQP